MSAYLISTNNDASGSGGGGSSSILAAAIQAIPLGASSVTVTYSSTIGSSGVPIFSFINTTDGAPIFLQGMITFFNTHGFLLLLNAPTDTANYSVSYTTTAVL